MASVLRQTKTGAAHHGRHGAHCRSRRPSLYTGKPTFASTVFPAPVTGHLRRLRHCLYVRLQADRRRKFPFPFSSHRFCFVRKPWLGQVLLDAYVTHSVCKRAGAILVDFTPRTRLLGQSHEGQDGVPAMRKTRAMPSRHADCPSPRSRHRTRAVAVPRKSVPSGDFTPTRSENVSYFTAIPMASSNSRSSIGLSR